MRVKTLNKRVKKAIALLLTSFNYNRSDMLLTILITKIDNRYANHVTGAIVILSRIPLNFERV